jgi:hypothetical protein
MGQCHGTDDRRLDPAATGEGIRPESRKHTRGSPHITQHRQWITKQKCFAKAAEKNSPSRKKDISVADDRTPESPTMTPTWIAPKIGLTMLRGDPRRFQQASNKVKSDSYRWNWLLTKTVMRSNCEYIKENEDRHVLGWRVYRR